MSSALRTFLALGLMVASVLVWDNNAPSMPEELGVPLFFALLAATVLVILDTLNINRYVPVPSFLRRPFIGIVAALLYSLMGLMLFAVAGISLSGILWATGTAVFIWDTVRHTPHQATVGVPPPLAAITPSKKRTFIGLGLLAFALLLRGNDAPDVNWWVNTFWWLAVLLLVAIMLPFGQRIPAVTKLNRSLLVTIVAALSILATIDLASFSLQSLFALVGTALFLSAAWQRSELGAFDPHLLLHGARLMLLIGVVLASISFAANWDGEMRTSGYTTRDYAGTWGGFKHYDVTWHPGQTFDGTDGHALGDDTFPSLLMMVAIGWAAWRGTGNQPDWFRFVPVAIALLLFIIGLNAIVADAQYVNGYPQEGIFKSNADGPWIFTAGLIPFYIGAILLALRGASTRNVLPHAIAPQK